MQSLKQTSIEQAQIISTEQAKLNKAVVSGHKQLTKDQEKHKHTYADIVKNQCHEIITSIGSRIEKLPNATASKHSGPPGASKEVAGILDAFMDKERRKCNIVVHNLKEPEGVTHDERMAADRARLTSLCRDALNLQVRVTNSFRAGKFNPSKPRLLIATLDSEAAKWELIKLAPQLRSCPGFSNIYVNPDRTREEREQSKRLRDELAARRAKGEQNLMIRRGKVIKVVNHAAAPGAAGPPAAAVVTEPAAVGGVTRLPVGAGGAGPQSVAGTAGRMAELGAAKSPTGAGAAGLLVHAEAAGELAHADAAGSLTGAGDPVLPARAGNARTLVCTGDPGLLACKGDAELPAGPPVCTGGPAQQACAGDAGPPAGPPVCTGGPARQARAGDAGPPSEPPVCTGDAGSPACAGDAGRPAGPLACAVDAGPPAEAGATGSSAGAGADDTTGLVPVTESTGRTMDAGVNQPDRS